MVRHVGPVFRLQSRKISRPGPSRSGAIATRALSRCIPIRYSPISMTDRSNPFPHRAPHDPTAPVSDMTCAFPSAGPDDGEKGDDEGGGDGEGQIGIATKTRTKPKKPSQFKVLLLNDDYTPMEFVVLVLKRFFRMDMEQATRVMLHVHQRGVGVCGIYPYEIAETKVNQVMDFARQNQHPLQCTLEKA